MGLHHSVIIFIFIFYWTQNITKKGELGRKEWGVESAALQFSGGAFFLPTFRDLWA